MPTLYVENVPDELYRGLRQQARKNRSSIAAEVILMLERNVPTPGEIKRRMQFYKSMEKLRSRPALTRGTFPSLEKMVREDRGR